MNAWMPSCDARVLEAIALRVAGAALTGESTPSLKRARRLNGYILEKVGNVLTFL
jgi:magnesium-transporting ATPase (P-type)